jgi:hypothetical protein
VTDACRKPDVTRLRIDFEGSNSEFTMIEMQLRLTSETTSSWQIVKELRDGGRSVETYEMIRAEK